MKITLAQVRLPKPATRWLPQASLFASQIVDSATNASQWEAELAHIKLNTQTPCPPRGAVPVSQGRCRNLQKLPREYEDVPFTKDVTTSAHPTRA